MQQYLGKGLGKGIVTGRIFFYNKRGYTVEHAVIDDPAAEMERYGLAKEEAKKQLQRIYVDASKEVGEDNARIFEAHKLMLNDFDEIVSNMVHNDRVCAEYAVLKAAENFAKMISGGQDDYIGNRCADVKDITYRLLQILSGGQRIPDPGEPVILATRDLVPSELMQIERSKLTGIVVSHDSANSHTVILARIMNIPVVCGIEVDPEWDGRTAVMDGGLGTLIVDPDPETIKKSFESVNIDEERKRTLGRLKTEPAYSKSGRKINIYANIGSLDDIVDALDNGADGVGLLRTEYMYLQSADYPSEEVQYAAYRVAAERMEGRRLVIRTFDLGADKRLPYGDWGYEENPAMGYRGIRVCLDKPEILRTQLRAIFRAAVHGDLAVMFPMIVSLEEVIKCKKHVAEIKDELEREGVPYGDDVKIGIMIETPAAALISDALAEQVDFFSIGTNDLTQFTLAADRGNPWLDKMNDTVHPAVMKLIGNTIENAHAKGIEVTICGELAADTAMTQSFIDMGVDALSVSPQYILPVKEAVVNSR